MMRRRVGVFLTTGALLVGTAFAIGCVGQNGDGTFGSTLAQATAQPTGTLTVLPAVTAGATGTTTGTTSVATSATGTITPAVPISPTATVVEGTPTPRPTPTGEPPDPESRLNIYQFYQTNNILVRRDSVQLDGSGADEVLYTLTGPDPVITGEFRSNINVLTYDATYREWTATWSSEPISGTATPLLSVAQSEIGGLNGRDLLRTGTPILMLRTTTADNRAHLFLYRWDAAGKKGDPLRMVPTGGGAEQNAAFSAELDLNVADLDDDGIYEVVADNVAGVQVWKWDGQKFVPEVAR